MLPVNAATELPTEGGIPLAFAMALIGLYLCVTGHDAFGHTLGFLVFENGIFALAILATYGLPSIVEAGGFLDVLVVVLLMGGGVAPGPRGPPPTQGGRPRGVRGGRPPARSPRPRRWR